MKHPLDEIHSSSSRTSDHAEVLISAGSPFLLFGIVVFAAARIALPARMLPVVPLAAALAAIVAVLVEAGCKTVVALRLKRSGMFWTVRGANAILALRCCHLNSEFEDYWEERRGA